MAQGLRDAWVHFTAKVHKTAILHPGVWIGPDVVIDEGAVIGHGSIIGGMPEHRDFYSDINGDSSLGVHIKAGARIFEYVTVHAGTKNMTVIGEGAAVFNKSHVAHDCIIERGAQIGGQVSLAGHVHVQPFANISGKSCLVQYSVVGAFAFVGGFTFLTRHVPPGEKWVGFPARFVSNNDIGLARAGLTYEECLEQYQGEFKKLIEGRVL